MREWKYTLDIRDLHNRYGNQDITVQEMAKGVAERLETLCKMHAELGESTWLEDIKERFLECSEDVGSTVTDYDDCLAEMYDFADDVRVWVRTLG